MIQKLRRRFVFAAMLSLALVMLGIIVPVNVVNYSRSVTYSDTMLNLLAERRGDMPERTSPEERNEPSVQDYRRRHIRDRGMHAWWDEISPEAPFEARFFTVSFAEDGTPNDLKIDRIFVVDEETALEAAQEILARGRTRGFWGDFRYLVQRLDGETLVICLDCGRSMNNVRTLGYTSVGITLLVLVLVLILLQLISGRIVRPVAESYEKQRRFITDAGHEIKTPLTIINADADLLELECGSSEWLEDIQRQTRRLTDLTNDLICLSRMDEEEQLQEAIEFPLSDVVEETAQSFQSLARRQNKELNAQIQPMISFLGREKYMRQLISILLDNALKYSPEHSVIDLKLEQTGKNLSLSVRNNTVDAMETDRLNNLFDRFFRLDDSRNSATGGYGLGLSIARSVAVFHKGRIRAEAPEDHTLVITAVFPVQ